MDNQEIINSTTDDDIDLNEIVSSIYRNKKLVLAFIISGIFLTSLIAFTTKKTWQGGFQIVIGQSKSMPENLAVNPSLLQLAGRSIVANKLETEVGILESPYLLMNIFKFVKKEKNNNKLRFSSWKESNLEIKLKDKTSILNVNYKDNEKSLIIPVLEKISKAYQEYSTEKQELSIKDSSKFLKKQIKIYKDKSIISNDKLQEFIIDNDLPAISLKAGSDINIDNDLPAISQKAGSDIYIENRLVKIKNKLVFLDDSIESIQSIPKEAKNANETNDIIYLVKNLDNKHLIEKADELSEMNSNISSLKNVYRETDKIIKDEKKKISGLYKYIRETALNYLYLEKDINIIRLKSFNRPKPILIKYNQLIRDAIKNQDIYYNLDNQYRVLQVNKARDSKNWDVITKPTLIPSPVAPHKKKMIIYGIFAGFIGGSLAGLVKDKIEDHVHSFSDITKLTSSPVLNYLSLDDDKSWEENLSIIAKGPLAERRGVTSILILGDFDKNILEDIHYKLNKYLNDIELIVTTDIIKAASSSNIIFVIGFGVTKKSKTIESMRKLNLLNKHILGTLIIST